MSIDTASIILGLILAIIISALVILIVSFFDDCYYLYIIPVGLTILLLSTFIISDMILSPKFDQNKEKIWQEEHNILDFGIDSRGTYASYSDDNGKIITEKIDEISYEGEDICLIETGYRWGILIKTERTLIVPEDYKPK